MSPANTPSSIPRQCVQVALAERSYDIVIGQGLLDDDSTWRQLPAGTHAMVVSNSCVAPH